VGMTCPISDLSPAAPRSPASVTRDPAQPKVASGILSNSASTGFRNHDHVMGGPILRHLAGRLGADTGSPLSGEISSRSAGASLDSDHPHNAESARITSRMVDRGRAPRSTSSGCRQACQAIGPTGPAWRGMLMFPRRWYCQPSRPRRCWRTLIVAGLGSAVAWTCPAFILRSRWGVVHGVSLCVQDLRWAQPRGCAGWPERYCVRGQDGGGHQV
jgi:hypothetical protein